jgi:hypothetical protein
LNQGAEDEQGGCRDDQRQERVDTGRGCDLERQVPAQEDQGEVGEVDDPEHPPGQREADGHHREQASGEGA